MKEVWLRPNRRALSLGLIPPVLIVAAGIGFALLFPPDGAWMLVRGAGWVLALVGAILGVGLIRLMAAPRLAYKDGALLVYLNASAPYRVPIGAVECFFLGQGMSQVRSASGREMETSTVVVRLADAAEDWKFREVKPALGAWCDGYITIQGAWCEPINGKLLARLNARLAEAQRQHRVAQESKPA